MSYSLGSFSTDHAMLCFGHDLLLLSLFCVFLDIFDLRDGQHGNMIAMALLHLKQRTDQ